MVACDNQLINYIEILLCNNADFRLRCGRDRSAITRVLLTCNLPILRLFEHYGARPLITKELKQSNDFIFNALLRGIEGIDLVFFLYERGATISVDEHGHHISLLSYLIQNGNLEMLKAINLRLPVGPHYRYPEDNRDINAPDAFKRTPLLYASTIPGRSDIVVYLIKDLGADINYRPILPEEDDMSAADEHPPVNINYHSVIEAVCDCEADLVDVVRILIDNEVDMFDGCRAVEYAVKRGRYIQVDLLLTYDRYDACINAYLQQAEIDNFALIAVLNKHQTTRIN